VCEVCLGLTTYHIVGYIVILRFILKNQLSAFTAVYLVYGPVCQDPALAVCLGHLQVAADTDRQVEVLPQHQSVNQHWH